jgi:hypothetical protein
MARGAARARKMSMRARMGAARSNDGAKGSSAKCRVWMRVAAYRRERRWTADGGADDGRRGMARSAATDWGSEEGGVPVAMDSMMGVMGVLVGERDRG